MNVEEIRHFRKGNCTNASLKKNAHNYVGFERSGGGTLLKEIKDLLQLLVALKLG